MSSFDKTIFDLKKSALAELTDIKNAADLERWEIKFLGRKGGALTNLLKGLPDLSEAERREAGRAANEVKSALAAARDAKQLAFQAVEFQALAESEWLDVSEPGRRPPQGHQHLVSSAIEEITAIFARLGFNRVRHPEIDWDWYAFESLNMPPEHPARDEWETFFIDTPPGQKGKVVLTPHTSNGQVREMEKGQLPIRMINIAKCYRRQIDVSHVPMFHQFEGLLVDEKVSVTHLKGILEYFARQFFGPERKIRLRPFHFRFTEPSFEVDVSCDRCSGQGCRLCKNGWLELAGAGLTHPNVLKAGGLDPKKYSALAFGFGVERTYLMKAGLQIDDIRILYKNDLRFLEQF